MAETHPGRGKSISPELYPKLTNALMRRQASLSIKVAAVFLAMLFLLPLVNYFWPEIAGIKVGGFTLTWLFLGVLFYPVTWVLSWYFIKASDRIEEECSDLEKLAGAHEADKEAAGGQVR